MTRPAQHLTGGADNLVIALRVLLLARTVSRMIGVGGVIRVTGQRIRTDGRVAGQENVTVTAGENDRLTLDPVGVDPVGADPVSADPVGVDRVGVDPVGVDRVGGDPVGVDPGGGDPVGGDPGSGSGERRSGERRSDERGTNENRSIAERGRAPLGRESSTRHEDPIILDDIQPRDLDRGARAELKPLTKENADWVARHLVAASRALETDPHLAHRHALAAARRAGRIAVVRETLGITAYATGDFGLAVREFRTFRRISGRNDQIALLVDSERGIQRPDRALETGRAVDRSTLSPEVQVALAIALSGARLDLGQIALALSELEIPQLDPDRAFSYSPDLFRAYAEVLTELGRTGEASTWLERAERAEEGLELKSDDVGVIVEIGDEGDEDEDEGGEGVGGDGDGGGGDVGVDGGVEGDAVSGGEGGGSAEAKRGKSDVSVGGWNQTDRASRQDLGTSQHGDGNGGDVSDADGALRAARRGDNLLGGASVAGTPLFGVDAVFADLDGVVYAGARAIPDAVESLRKVAVRMPVGYITNNASRSDSTVAAHLRELGLDVAPEHVVTSPQAAMRLLAEHVAAPARVLVVGGEGIVTELERLGYVVVRSATEQPDAVVQGFAPEVGWRDLAEAAFALRCDEASGRPGIPWIVTNMDWTIPVAGGIAPGNGTLVSAVHTAAERMPLVAGKPETPIFVEACSRFGVRTPLMIGDRLDTDILGAHRAGLVSALVLTGIDGAKQVLSADAARRPRDILGTLAELHEAYPLTTVAADATVTVGRARVRVEGRRVVIINSGQNKLDLLRAGCRAIWNSSVGIHSMDVPEELYR